MKTKYSVILGAALLFSMSACQNNDYEIAAPIVAPIAEDAISGQLVGNDYVWSWTPEEGKEMQVTILRDGQAYSTLTSSTGTVTHANVETKVPFTYVFKLKKGDAISTGVIKHYTRLGADPVSGITMAQVEKAGAGYDVAITWTPSADATTQKFTASNGSRTVNADLAAAVASYTIENVSDGEEWNVTIVASNNDGVSVPVSSSLKIGKTAVGYLSQYPTEQDLIANGDDDEACAWLWLKSEYPSASYIYFGDITSADQLEPYRVLFWLRDLEEGGGDDVFRVPAVVENATPYVTEWYKNGGNILLWSHATAYIGNLGRLDTQMLSTNDRSIGVGKGGYNKDTWFMAVQLHPGSRFKKDHSNHPIFKGLDVVENDRTKLIPFKGAGWTEDHNCLYFNIPAVLTGLGNQDEPCYNALIETYGIYPLGTWDSQIDWVSQLNVWEARQGNTDYKGTALCIGNGGCEFSLRNADGTPDISAYPKNNPYQGNVLKLAKNSIEYLKTR